MADVKTVEPENPASGGSPILKLLLLAAILLAGLAAYKFTPIGEFLSRDGIAQVIGTLRSSPWAPLIFVGIYAGATALAIPGSVLTLIGGGVFGFWFGVLYNSLGANIGANAAFLMSRALGKDGVRRILGERAGAFDQMTKDHGFQGLLTLRLIPVFPFNALNFGSGLTGMSWRSYAMATLIGILPGTAVYTFFADALLQGSQEASRDAWIRVLIAGLLLVALTLLPTMLKRLKKVPAGAALVALALFPALACGTEGLDNADGLDGSDAAAAMTSPADEQGPQGAAWDLPDHAAFTSVLTTVVRDGRVDYADLETNRSMLDQYLTTLGAVDLSVFDDVETDETLAFWINAYNACMLKRVLDHYPIESASGLVSRVRGAVAGYPENSVQQIGGVFKDAHCVIAGAERSQDAIEHEILRPMGDPRIHFAINCAAVSCPELSGAAYEGSTVHEQLDDAVRRFMADERHYRLEDGVLRLNKVLDWFGEDFGGATGLRSFFHGYVDGGAAEMLADSDTGVEFFDYDWTLNDTGA